MRQPRIHTPLLLQPTDLVGTWRRFGAAGPVYEIIEAGRALPDGDRMMRVRVIETGEELDYRVTDILDDPPGRSVHNQTDHS
jgi:hypothetical protein